MFAQHTDKRGQFNYDCCFFAFCYQVNVLFDGEIRITRQLASVNEAFSGADMITSPLYPATIGSVAPYSVRVTNL